MGIRSCGVVQLFFSTLWSEIKNCTLKRWLSLFSLDSFICLASSDAISSS